MDRMMEHPVADGRLGDPAALRVMDDEPGILAMCIASESEISAKPQEMFFRPLRERDHVRFHHFPPLEFPPRRENIFRCDNLFKQTPMNIPPPRLSVFNCCRRFPMCTSSSIAISRECPNCTGTHLERKFLR